MLPRQPSRVEIQPQDKEEYEEFIRARAKALALQQQHTQHHQHHQETAEQAADQEGLHTGASHLRSRAARIGLK